MRWLVWALERLVLTRISASNVLELRLAREYPAERLAAGTVPEIGELARRTVLAIPHG